MIEVLDGLRDVIACESKISRIELVGDRAILEYRGYDIRDLAKYATYEEVAYLLLYGELPKKIRAPGLQD